MGAARYVGRVGGLAVALGVGLVVFTGHGVASADADTSTPASTSQNAGPAAPAKPKHPKIHLQSPRQSTAASTANVTANLTKPTTARATNGVVKKANGSLAVSANTIAPERISKDVTRATEEVAKSATAPKSPPADSPAAWVALAATRRELGSDRITYAPIVDVRKGVITGTNHDTESSSDLPLTYTVVDAPDGGGKVDIDKTSGSYTYLPYSSGQNPDGSQKFTTSEEFKVLVAETTPFDQALEDLPVVGALARPVLVRIHQVPIVGVALSPLIGDATVIPVIVDDAQLAAQHIDPIAFTTTVVSFDGTPISVNYFPALGLKKGLVAPTILNGPSLATAGYTDPNQETTVFGLVPGLKPLRADGYNVVTWDPRGEFASGGVLQLDSPDFEAKDVSSIITWVAGQPETKFDPETKVDSTKPSTPDGAVNNPLIGMVGGSYGGGIQLTSAGIDKRIDAIAPGIAWNSLETALYPNHGFKTSFASLLLLSLAVSGSRINHEIYSGILTGALLGFLTPGQLDFLNEASPFNVVDNITVPTLLLQGTVDDLFPLPQAVDNAEEIQAANAGVPVKMIWYCGGHGQCLDPVNQDEQTKFLTKQTLDWMDKYVKYKGHTPPSPIDIPTFQWVDQHGDLYSSQYLPTAHSDFFSNDPIVASGDGGLLPIVPVLGGSGPQTKATFPVSLALGSKALNAIDVSVPNPNAADSDAKTYIVGAPTLTMTYSGLGTSRDVYAQLVDTSTGRVVGNILTPIPVKLDGKTREVSVDLEDIAYTMDPGDSLTLQIVGSATPFENFTSYGVINVSSVDLTVPTADPEAVTFEKSLRSKKPPVSAGGLLGI